MCFPHAEQEPEEVRELLQVQVRQHAVDVDLRVANAEKFTGNLQVENSPQHLFNPFG